jgi:hypothetical protein
MAASSGSSPRLPNRHHSDPFSSTCYVHSFSTFIKYENTALQERHTSLYTPSRCVDLAHPKQPPCNQGNNIKVVAWKVDASHIRPLRPLHGCSPFSYLHLALRTQLHIMHTVLIVSSTPNPGALKPAPTSATTTPAVFAPLFTTCRICQHDLPSLVMTLRFLSLLFSATRPRFK